MRVYNYQHKPMPLEEISWVCQTCGELYGNGRPKSITVSTWHQGHCDICGNEKAVTEVRDFGYIDKNKLATL